MQFIWLIFACPQSSSITDIQHNINTHQCNGRPTLPLTYYHTSSVVNMTCVRKHSARRLHAPRTDYVVKNKHSKRNTARATAGKSLVHRHSAVRLVTDPADLRGWKTDPRKMLLSLLGALKWRVSNGLADTARNGLPPSVLTRNTQALLGQVAVVAMGLTPKGTEHPQSTGLFLKRRVVDVSGGDDSYWQEVLSAVEERELLPAEALAQAKKSLGL